jgi:hypothetical protein
LGSGEPFQLHQGDKTADPARVFGGLADGEDNPVVLVAGAVGELDQERTVHGVPGGNDLAQRLADPAVGGGHVVRADVGQRVAAVIAAGEAALNLQLGVPDRIPGAVRRRL